MDFIQILLHISIGFIMAFLGLLSPGLLTMTTLNTVIERGKKETVKFVTGVIIPIFFQAHIALLGADYLKKHPEIIQSFSKIAIYVFLVLSFIFYWQYKNRNKQAEINNYQIQNSLLLVFLFLQLIL
jgi:threonine/homoserine/homoserine lactone efflux protein